MLGFNIIKTYILHYFILIINKYISYLFLILDINTKFKIIIIFCFFGLYAFQKFVNKLFVILFNLYSVF